MGLLSKFDLWGKFNFLSELNKKATQLLGEGVKWGSLAGRTFPVRYVATGWQFFRRQALKDIPEREEERKLYDELEEALDKTSAAMRQAKEKRRPRREIVEDFRHDNFVPKL